MSENHLSVSSEIKSGSKLLFQNFGCGDKSLKPVKAKSYKDEDFSLDPSWLILYSLPTFPAGSATGRTFSGNPASEC